MEINISEEQILKLAESRVKQLVDSKVKEVLNSMYWQDLSNRINQAVDSVVREKLSDEVINNAFKKVDMLQQTKLLGESIATEIIKSISDMDN